LKELGLLRHAKSDWKGSVKDDHDRPLASRGLEAARLMGKFVATGGIVPEAAYSSSAERARRTLELAMESGRWGCSAGTETRLYLADRKSIQEFVRKLPDELDRVILVGHNPGNEEFLSSLVGGGSFKLPTASLAWVKLSVDRWENCGPGCGTLTWLVTPKLLNRLGLSF
jgi:phosphohistidine phosphatase